MSRRGNSLENVKTKLDNYFNNGNFYEAQQLHMSLYNRLSSRKKYNDAIDLLESGILSLLDHDQTNGAVELSIKLLEAYSNSERQCDEEVINKLIKMFDKMDQDNVTARTKFMTSAIKWSSTVIHDPAGHNQLNLSLAMYLSSKNNHANAQRYWLRARSPLKHAKALIKWSKEGLNGERDLFVARAVLQYCCLQNLADANVLYNEYVSNMNLNSSLLNFTKFLLKTLERDAAPLFQLLRSKYTISLKRDPQFDVLLDKIGQIYYNLRPPKSMFEGLLETFMGGSRS